MDTKQIKEFIQDYGYVIEEKACDPKFKSDLFDILKHVAEDAWDESNENVFELLEHQINFEDYWTEKENELK